ncbi:MAG: reverse transcriptase domain-containing protein [Candidatus Thiodiazotropha sp.]
MIERQLLKTLQTLKQRDLITTTEFNQVKPTGSRIPRLYGLPKVHKNGAPLRPILDMNGSPYHALAKWLTNKLKPLRDRLAGHCVKDSFQFVEHVRDQRLRNKRMISLDVNALFTNVPLIETVDYVCSSLESLNLDVGLPVQIIKELLLRCTLNVQFLSNGRMYRQIDGVAMGSPLGPLLADLFMAKLENTTLQPTINSLPLYLRYVDDTFLIIEDTVEPTEILNQFNNAHCSIRFTHEIEDNDSLSFLDVLLTKKVDGSLKRSVYRKKTWAGQYTNFHSFVPLQRKRNLVKTLAYRARNICSDDTIVEELDFVSKALMENGYPPKFVQMHMKERLLLGTIATVSRKPIYMKLPFRGDSATHILSDRLNNAIRRVYPMASLRISYYSKSVFIPSLKDKLPASTISMCIYQFTCSCGARYIGRTTRQLSKRAREHLPAWFSKGLNKSINSSILLHLMETGHAVDKTRNFRIIYHVPLCSSRFVQSRILNTAEAVAIRLNKPELCKQKRFVQSLSLPWAPIQLTTPPIINLPHPNYQTNPTIT